MGRKPKTVLYRRKREKKTDYNKRLKLLLSNKPRLVVRITNQRVLAQIVEFTPLGDKVVAAAESFALKKMGWKYSCKNIPAAYLTGLLIGKKGQEKGSKEVIFDTGLVSPLKKGKVFAFLKGVLDAGLNVPTGSEEIFPNEARISGQHIAQYLKSDNKPEEIPKIFADIKGKIIK
jgi:large subunit ribosomal protein L18